MTQDATDSERPRGGDVTQTGSVVIDARSTPLSLAALSEKEMDELRRSAEKYKAAQERYAKAIGTLWNAQADAARAAGRSDLAGELKPLHLWDDCSCC